MDSLCECEGLRVDELKKQQHNSSMMCMLIKGFCKKGCIHETLELFRKMDSKGFEAAAYTFVFILLV